MKPNIETVETMEPILFTNIVEREFMQNKPSYIIPVMKVVGSEWGLNISKKNHYEIARKIVLNSIKNN